MCLGMNPDQLAPGERSASTSNRNFEGRQGKGGAHPPRLAAGRRRDRRPGPRLDRPPADLGPRRDRHGEVHLHTGRALPLRRSNVDTDQIIPADTSSGSPAPASRTACSRPGARTRRSSSTTRAYAGASVLVAGPDFGTGSSREHAVWALQDYGFRVVLVARASATSSAATPARSACSRRVVDQDGRRAALGGRRGGPEHRGDGRPRGRAGPRPLTSSRRSRSTTTPAGGCIGGPRRHRADAAARGRHHAFEATRPAFAPTTR